MAGVSSKYSGILHSTPAASAMRVHSSTDKTPVRSFLPDTLASDDSKRFTISSLDISKLKNATLRFCLSATLRAKLSAKLVLPIPGRAPTTIRFERFRPVVMASKLGNPVGMPMYFSLSGEVSLLSIS